MSAIYHARSARNAAFALAIALVLVLFTAACGGDDDHTGSSSVTVPSTTTTPTKGTTTSAAPRTVCGNPGPAPRHYQSIVVFSFENRTWARVGLGFGPSMPYLHSLGQQCTYFTHWAETDPKQSSLTQYVGQVTGAPQPGTQFDCSPSASNAKRRSRVVSPAARSTPTRSVVSVIEPREI